MMLLGTIRAWSTICLPSGYLKRPTSGQWCSAKLLSGVFIKRTMQLKQLVVRVNQLQVVSTEQADVAQTILKQDSFIQIW
jgi:hypothetical protein